MGGTVTANKFKITGVTNGTNNNDGTVTPTTPTNSTAIEGGVARKVIQIQKELSLQVKQFHLVLVYLV